ncbi:Guanine nucleotide-binding protein G(z) subunit alpha [Platysternon megacephalum]|uniref:Guanine nucleotide-binding protein G(Z) subunit alpha n=1 Tax=Platysternon megacephalum TaxID=55544 RepID=A0A4D9DWQ4_9SAUR|nr:Guanine nucleotide-binding protein G(z) subunit alpha [Platysternon megacephalum]
MVQGLDGAKYMLVYGVLAAGYSGSGGASLILSLGPHTAKKRKIFSVAKEALKLKMGEPHSQHCKMPPVLLHSPGKPRSSQGSHSGAGCSQGRCESGTDQTAQIPFSRLKLRLLFLSTDCLAIPSAQPDPPVDSTTQ